MERKGAHVDAGGFAVGAEERRGAVHLEHLQLAPLGVRRVVEDLQIPHTHLVLRATTPPHISV